MSAFTDECAEEGEREVYEEPEEEQGEDCCEWECGGGGL